MKYVAKENVVEAFLWTGENSSIPDWLDVFQVVGSIIAVGNNGKCAAVPDHYVVRLSDGSFDALNKEDFKEMYEQVTPITINIECEKLADSDEITKKVSDELNKFYERLSRSW